MDGKELIDHIAVVLASSNIRTYDSNIIKFLSTLTQQQLRAIVEEPVDKPYDGSA